MIAPADQDPVNAHMQFRCPCGHCFTEKQAKGFRGCGGRWFNREVKHASIDGNIEIQCPKCLLWFEI